MSDLSGFAAYIVPMSDSSHSGVQIGHGSAYVRLRRKGASRAGPEMTAEIEAKGGPFTGVVRDETLVGVAEFCADLQSLYDKLTGSASLTSYEKFKVVVEGDGRGHISGSVELHGEHVPLSVLTYDIELDQTSLPEVIRGLRKEFPSD